MYTWQLPVVAPQPMGAGHSEGKFRFLKRAEGQRQKLCCPGLTPGRVQLPPLKSYSSALHSAHGKVALKHTFICYVYLLGDCELLQDALAPSSLPALYWGSYTDAT